MPIIRKSVEWSETECIVSIKVAVRGMTKTNTSILSSSRYLKLSSPPFFWEAFLKDSVKVNDIIVRIGDNSVSFLLTKQKKEIWNELYDPKSDDKFYCQKMRMDALAEIQANAEDDRKKRQIKKSERDRAAVQLQISLESEERKRIDEIKENERKKVASEIENWQLASETSNEPVQNKSLRNEQITRKKEVKIETAGKQHEKCRKIKPSKLVTNEQTKETLESLPSPRTSGHITVSFSPREFPTAARESKKEEEDEWLQKQAKARQCTELQCSDLRPEERNPIWLKDRGDDFYFKGDYLAAINAYNLAIRMCPKLPSLYSNRAACHLKCRNLHKAIEDTSEFCIMDNWMKTGRLLCSKNCSSSTNKTEDSTVNLSNIAGALSSGSGETQEEISDVSGCLALELLTPPVEANAAARLKCHIRRGTAFCQLELYVEGLQDYEAALKIDPNHAGVKEDAMKIRKVIQCADA